MSVPSGVQSEHFVFGKVQFVDQVLDPTGVLVTAMK
jgi:hypothetical protein